MVTTLAGGYTAMSSEIKLERDINILTNEDIAKDCVLMKVFYDEDPIISYGKEHWLEKAAVWKLKGDTGRANICLEFAEMCEKYNDRSIR